MQFYVMACTYMSYGGFFDLIPQFLLGEATGFGSALSELSVTFHFRTSSPPPVGSMFEEEFTSFHANRSKLPKVVFRRTRSQADIHVASDLIDGKDWERLYGCLPLPLFRRGVLETIAALELLRKRLTAKDDFRLEQFLTHCNQSQARLPSTEKELVALAKECEKRQDARIAALSPWERLGINWGDFHADARKILDDPFLWESANDFSPNGNDTGADLLEDYRSWLRRNPSGDPLEFYHRLLRKWGFATRVDDLGQSVIDETAVALAFAEIKLHGSCSPAVAALARQAIQRQRKQALESIDWPHRAERLRTLNLIEAKLSLDH